MAAALADDGLDEAVAALRGFALVDRETIMDEREPSIATDAIRLHRLVREIAAARRLEGEARDQLRPALVAALMMVYPGDGYSNPASWPRCAPLTPHVLKSCETEMADVVASEECADLLDSAGNYKSGRAVTSFSILAFSSATTWASVRTKPSCAILASSALSRVLVFARSWRYQTARTPNGEIDTAHAAPAFRGVRAGNAATA
jgi:hypothetical protein